MSNVPWFPAEIHETNERKQSIDSMRQESGLEATVKEEETSKQKIEGIDMNTFMNIPISLEMLQHSMGVASTSEEIDVAAEIKQSFDAVNQRKMRTRKYQQHTIPKLSRPLTVQFTKEELAAKRQAAIEEEALKKVLRDEIARKKEEEKWIEVGRAICSLSPEEFGLPNFQTDRISNEVTGDEIVLNVANFVNNLKQLVGNQTKGTVLANTNSFTGALCGVNQKSVLHVDQRVERTKRTKEELILREKEQKDRLTERWVEIGKAICAFTLEDFGISVADHPKASSVKPVQDLTPTVVDNNASNSKTSARNSRGNSEESEYGDNQEEGDEEEEEEDDDDEDFAPSFRKRKRKSKKTIAWRGEDVVANVFSFSTAIRELMGLHSKHTVIKSAYEFTSVFCNVAEKSVRDRHSIKKPRK